VLIRSAGDALVLSPPLVIADAEIDRLFLTIADAIRS
jgi:beta-alanine--pyruvate transaminase